MLFQDKFSAGWLVAGLLLVGLPLYPAFAGTAGRSAPVAAPDTDFSGLGSPVAATEPLLVAQAFNRAASFPAGEPDDRIVVSGASKVLTLRQATDPESDALTYGLRNAPSWLTPDSTSPWEITAAVPDGEPASGRVIGLQATDAGSDGTAEDVLRLEVIDPTEFSDWDLVDGQLQFVFNSGWCQGQIERVGEIGINYGGSKVAGIEPAWQSLNCSAARPVAQDATIAGSSRMLFYTIDDEQLRVSAPLLAAGSHNYEFAVELDEVLTAGGTATTLDLDSATAALNYTLVDQDFSLAESANPVAAGTALITLTLAGSGVANSPQWSVYGSPLISLEIAAVSGSESTEAVVSLGEEAVLDYEAGASLVSATIIARTAASETTQQAVFTNLHLMLTNEDEPPFFPVEFPDQRARSGAATNIEFPAAMDPEGDALEYTTSTLPTGVTFTSTSTRRFFTVANIAVQGSYAITVTAAEQGNTSNAASQSFMLQVVAVGIVADTSALTELDQHTRSATFHVQLGSAPTGNVTIELASALSEQLRVAPTVMIFDSGNWNTDQEAELELLDAALEDKSGVRSIAVTVAVADEMASDSVYRMAAPAQINVQVNIVNAAPVFSARQRIRSIFENINDGSYPAGTRVMLPVVATDVDNDNREDLTYMLVGSSDLFGVDEDTGQITLSAESSFNHEDSDVAGTITIKVADNEPEASRGHATVTVAIGVADLDEPPVLAELENQYLIAGSGGSYRIPAATDQDGGTITYRAAPSSSAVGALPDGITFDDDPDSATFRTFTFASSFSGTVLLWVEAMDATSMTSVQSFFVIAAAGGEILPDRAVGQLAVSRQQRKVTIGLALSLQPDSQDVTLTLESANDAMLELDIDTMEFSTSNWNDAQELVATMTDAAVAAKMLQTVAISAGVYQSASSDSLYQSTANLSIVVELDSRNQPPRFDAEQVAQIELAIDENLGTIALAAAADIGMPIDEVVDEDNDAFKYRILGTSAEFQIDMDSGQLAAQSGINFNHERTSGYTLTIEVNDQDGGTDLVTVQVSVNDLPETPASYDGSSFMVAGRSRDALTLGWNNTDFYGQYDQQDRGRIAISYGGGGYLATLDLPASATQATVAGLVPGVSYDLTLHWYSQDGLTQSSPHSSAIISAANVSINNAPLLDAGSLARSLVEQVGDQPPLAAGTVLATVEANDANNDELAYSIVGGADAALFAIDAQSGVISALEPLRLDHETKDSYRFMVQVQDSYGGRDRQQFALMVTDAVEPNQPPQLPDQAAHRAVVGTAHSFSVAAATDPEGDSLVYEIVSVNGTITSTAPSWLTFTAATGGFAVDATNAVAGNYTIAIKAVETGNSPNLETQVKTLVLAVAADATNVIPTLAAMFEFNELEENTDYRFGHEVGVVTATDTDTGDSLTYRIYGQDAAEFAISGSPGTISLQGSRRFDREMKDSYRFVVEVSDGNPGGVVSAPVVVNIGNVNEAPQFPEIPDQRVVRGTPATFMIPPAVDPDPETGRSLAYSVHTPGPWLTFVGSTRTFTVLPSAPAGLYTLVVVAAEMGGASAPLTGEQDFVVAVHPSGSPLRPQVASLFNQAPEFPDPAPNGRIVVSGTSKVLTLRQASDPEGEALFYGLRNAPSWLVQTSVPWKVIVSPPVGEESGSRLVGLQATDTGSGGTAEDVWRLEVIDPTEFFHWAAVGERLDFVFDSGWCQGRIERRGSIDIDYGGSAAVSIEPVWESINCTTPRSVTQQITIGANLHTVAYIFIEDRLHVSLPMLAAGDHQYDFAVSLQEVLTASGTTTILDLDSAAAALSYTLVEQDFSIAESADPVAGGTALITLTLAGGGVVSSPQWSVHGAPRVSLEVAAVSGSESTEAVVSLGEETVLDYEAGASLVSVTIIARTAASETNQQAVFTDLHLMLTPVDEPPRFPAAFPDQRVRSGTAASFDFHAAEDPEGADLVYTPSSLPTGVTFTSNSTRRFFTVANTAVQGSYAITVTAAEQGNSASSVEQSFVLHIVAAGIVADTTSLVPVTGETQVSGFALQLGSAPTGNVTIELASALSVQLQGFTDNHDL